jgi:hypothetical protein
LNSAVPLVRIVFIVDGTTNKPFLRQTINQAWWKMRPNSPNRNSFQLHLFRFEEAAEGHLQGLFSALCTAAQGH